MNLFSLRLLDLSDNTELQSVLNVFWYLFVIIIVTRLLLMVLFPSWYDDSTLRDLNIVVDPYLNDVKYAVSYWSLIGKRNYQEDRYDCGRGKGLKDSSLYGVYDGHGGYRASAFCKEHMLDYIRSHENFKTEPKQAIIEGFHRVNNEFCAMAKQKFLSDGSTALVVCIHDNHIYVANTGDCRAIIICHDKSTIAMSLDHKPNRKDEEERIKLAGGKVVHWGRWRVQGVLAVSRAIGDINLHPYIIADPEILEKPLNIQDALVVIASDGVWDTMSNDDVAEIVLDAYRNKPFVDVAKELCTHAYLMGSQDNITAQIIDLGSPKR